ncbi:MAG: ATP-binding protein [Cuspidothrix sp.]
MITSSKPQRNPYIVGRPVDQQLFFGRESLFSSLQDDLKHNRNIILLHGQRRSGKSSVIKNIPYQLSDLHEFVFVTFNLEYYSQESLSRILAELAKEIISDLSLDYESINLPGITELELEPEIFSDQFLPQVYQALKNKRLVFLIDEFDALLNSNNPELLQQVYQYYQSLIVNFRKKLFLILLIEQKSVNHPTISKIFKDVPIREIGLLDKNNTKKLIIEPAKNILEYEEDAIEEIFNLSAGHPYFIQAICFTIFGRARENDHWKVNKEDVESIINKAIEISEAGLAWFWDGFSIPEKIVFAAIAEAQGSSENYVALIKRFRPDTEDKQIIQMEQFLRTNGFLDEIEQKVKIELVRLWIIQRHSLREEISELDKIEQKKIKVI